MTTGLSASDHVRDVISKCAQTLYALRVLRAKADLPTDPPQADQTRFWTPNPPDGSDPPVSRKTRLKFDWTFNDAFSDAFNLLEITNLWGQISLENVR